METFPPQGESAPEQYRYGQEHGAEIIDVEDFEEAREIIADAIKRGELPIVSVPEEYKEVAHIGIEPNTTWVGEKIIAGTILRPPYVPKGESRSFFKIHVPPKQVEPRFTGPDGHFHGVVAFRGPISSDDMEEVSL